MKTSLRIKDFRCQSGVWITP